MDVFEEYSETPFLLRFIYMEFHVPVFDLFHYVDVCDGIFVLDFNVFIVYLLFIFVFNVYFLSRSFQCRFLLKIVKAMRSYRF